MAQKITKKTRLKKGDLVRLWGKIVIGVVVRHEKFLGHSGFYAFNNSPGDKEFIKESGVDWYTRYHINDLVRDDAEVITPTELVCMYEHAMTTIRSLEGRYVPYQNDTLQNCQKKKEELLLLAKRYQDKIDELTGNNLVTITKKP